MDIVLAYNTVRSIAYSATAGRAPAQIHSDLQPDSPASPSPLAPSFLYDTNADTSSLTVTLQAACDSARRCRCGTGSRAFVHGRARDRARAVLAIPAVPVPETPRAPRCDWLVRPRRGGCVCACAARRERL
jgi:hypothetical protein